MKVKRDAHGSDVFAIQLMSFEDLCNYSRIHFNAKLFHTKNLHIYFLEITEKEDGKEMFNDGLSSFLFVSHFA